ncbi:Copper/zinc superoxide dismutase 2 isoform 1 [Hibiscus syriacus]|uniref:Copper/zinc superoxide dismutase 2 isoform 1 n=1 Tax=Hibiscus syriacus TaxID=106335 RepID=A0A6A2ZAG4_HIBSY|nr:Copper/zinc superoxide dismutase 2 isoform 1 [Hibiscus syriacus]
MEAQEEVDRQALIIKGKRTKRQRSLSPFGVTVTSSSSSACGGGPAEEYNSISSPVTSGESTEEEEDMANCLIMLAQSDGPKRSNNGEKFQMVTASHKRPKGAMADDKKPPVSAVKDHVIEDADQFNRKNPAVVALQASNNNSKGNCHGNKGYKLHECSICGSEFSSGQALGGHMRRHRAAAAAGNQAAVSVETSSSPIESRNGDGIKPRNILQLDLNLPAPEDDPRDSKFQFGAPQQAIVFSTPALVDCHY